MYFLSQLLVRSAFHLKLLAVQELVSREAHSCPGCYRLLPAGCKSPVCNIPKYYLVTCLRSLPSLGCCNHVLGPHTNTSAIHRHGPEMNGLDLDSDSMHNAARLSAVLQLLDTSQQIQLFVQCMHSYLVHFPPDGPHMPPLNAKRVLIHFRPTQSLGHGLSGTLPAMCAALCLLAAWPIRPPSVIEGVVQEARHLALGPGGQPVAAHDVQGHQGRHRLD